MGRRTATAIVVSFVFLVGCASAPPTAAPAPAPPPSASPPAPAPAAKAEPVVVKGERLGDPNDPRFRPIVPKKYAIPGKQYAGTFRICVSAQGTVSEVTTTTSTGEAEIDATWAKTIETWPYRPYSVNGRPLPYCHPLRLEVKVDPFIPGQGTPKGEQAPKMVPPNVGAGMRLADITQDPRYRPRLPPEYSKAGARYWALFKICVSRAGSVHGVDIIKPVGVQEIDEAWYRLIWTWPHRPYLINGVAVPVCYPSRIEVRAE
jgi:outer membrane biosynthesis protein TonB